MSVQMGSHDFTRRNKERLFLPRVTRLFSVIFHLDGTKTFINKNLSYCVTKISLVNFKFKKKILQNIFISEALNSKYFTEKFIVTFSFPSV